MFKKHMATATYHFTLLDYFLFALFFAGVSVSYSTMAFTNMMYGVSALCAVTLIWKIYTGHSRLYAPLIEAIQGEK